MIFAAAAFLFNSEANAQLTKDTEGYKRAEASFHVQSLDDDGELDISAKGFELGYIQGINITSNMPLFLELGGQLAFSHSKDEIKFLGEKVGEEKYTFMSLAIPVNVAYKLSFSNSENFSVVPFVGPNFKFNLIGKYDFGNDNDGSFFDEDKMGDAKARRFQVGLNLGAGVNIAKTLYVGYRFQPDFIKYSKEDDYKVSSHASYITVGINF